MWKVLTKIIPIRIPADNVLQTQIRTTFILKRRVAPFVHKKGYAPRKLRSRHHIYELVEDTNVTKQPNIDVILTKFVDGLGNAGQKVSVKPLSGYHDLLLPGLAVYATPENVEKYEKSQNEDEVRYSSPSAYRMMQLFARSSVSVVMNKDVPWTITPWHIRASFRKCSFIVPEEAIELPEKPISGPNLELDNKIFYVRVTINKTEKVHVKCRLHHWSTNIVDRLPYVEKFWEKDEYIFPEDKDKHNANQS